MSSIDQAVNATPQSGSQTTQDPGAASPAFPGATTNGRVAQAGETVVKDGLSLTSSAVKAGDSTYGKSLCTAVHYSNGTTATVSFNAFDWKMQDPDGTILSTTFGGSQKMLDSGELEPGGNVSGDVCFDNKSGTPGQHIVLYQGSIFSGDRIAWLNKA
ncbi:DUF4352 domain-containing protein [Pseudonocardia sp.]|uniref:DUF4352 domain-containing protein n=1 Tax=Pseudonocardia sp. TaxID=60912 RepID=UPI002633C647|nr:DUF4352 domain-containing protein [Pseudonocardia sp.]